MTYLLLGVITHVVIAALLIILNAPPWFIVTFAFFLKERGEIKKEVPGSVKTWAKQKEMLRRQFMSIRLIQWALPGAVAFIISEYKLGDWWF